MTASVPRGEVQVRWHTDDAETLARFLSSPTGSRVLSRLASSKPDVSRLKEGDSAKFLLGRVSQFDAMLGLLISLADPSSAEDRVDGTPVPSVSAPTVAGSPNYPDLDDDKAWPAEPQPR